MKLSFEEHGRGFPIFLIHAFPLSRRMWDGQIKTLTEGGFRVVLPDLFGFGQTPPAKEVNSLEDFAVEIRNLLDYLSIEYAVIGGLSMGGYVAFNFYRLFPEKCAALVLADTAAAADTEEKRASRIETVDKIKQNGVGLLTEEMLPNLISDDTKKENPPLLEKLAGYFSEVSKDGAINALTAMAERRDHTSLLKDINIPTALIFGEHDKVTNLENARKMASAMPYAELRVIKQAGHYSNLEQPAEFNRILLDFLRTLKNNV